MKKLFEYNTYFLSPFALKIWLVCTGLFLVHQVLQYGLWISVPWMDNWLDPLLFPIIVLPLLRWERRRITRKYFYSFSFMETIATTAALVIMSELLLPFFSDRFITDLLDALCILTGGIIFHFAMQHPK